jgi:predicted regulator of Ras-like GTPase activity (Roadblock/LC7/MglB family)
MSVMSSTVKTKFAGLLRGLLRRLDEDEAPAIPTVRVLTSSALPAGAAPAAVAVPHPAPPPASMPAAARFPEAVDNPDELPLPLQPVLASLTMDLRAKIMQTPPPDTMISIPLEKILTQLAFGSVKINFGELRQAAPGVFVNSGGEHDHKPVTLPLNEILTRLNPARFSRRVVQKRVEVAEDIAGPFGPGGQGAKISASVKPTPSTTLTQRTTPQSLRMVAPAAPAAAQPTPVAPPPPAFVPRAITPAAGVAAPPSSLSHDTSLVGNTAVPCSNGNGAPKPIVSPPPPHAPAAPVPAPAAPVPAPLADTIPMEAAAISAPLTALSEHWPEGLRLEIIQSALAHAQVLLPINLVEPALKRGRITFTWRSLRPLIKPTPPTPSVHDSLELELPLSVIAPLFLGRQKTAPRPQPVTQPPTDIPNLFFGFPQPESSPLPPAPPLPVKTPEPPPVQAAPEPPVFRPAPKPSPLSPDLDEPIFRPIPKPSPALADTERQTVRPASPPPPPRPAAKPLDTKITDSNYYIWGDDGETPRVDETEYRHIQRPATDFTSRYATPKEIVERALDLPGVVGALVALPDGLRVASQVPAELNADNLAAFLPQIFDRVSQSTKELRMGALNNFNFTVGNVPWRIFRVNAVYFAAFGNAGEALPGAQLAALAAELDRKKQ